MADDLSTKPTMSLCDRLHALPQELFDEIYDFTFTVPAGKEIRTDWRVFPSVLKVNRAHRNELGTIYYYQNNFVFWSVKEAVNWYKLLGSRQRGMMRPKTYWGHSGQYTELDDYGFTTKKNVRIMTREERSDEEAKLVNWPTPHESQLKWPTPRESQLGRKGLSSSQRSVAVGMAHVRMTEESWRPDLQTQSATQFPALPKTNNTKTVKSTGVTSLAIRYNSLGLA